MLTTNLTRRLGIKTPIIQAGMQRLGRAKLAAEVSNCGGLGVITAASFKTKDEFEREIDLVRSKTLKPFGVNVSIGRNIDPELYFDVIHDKNVKIIFTSGRNPQEYLDLIRRKDVFWAHAVTSVRHAKKAEELGVDAVIATGYEAGGHPGVDEIPSSVLIPSIVKNVDIPVIAAGGIVTGQNIVSVLSLGAEAAILGTRFILTDASAAHENTKQAYLNAKTTDTVVIEKTIRKNHRVLNTPRAQEVLKLEEQKAPIEEILKIINGEQYRKTMEEGDLDAGVISCGMGVGLINEILTVKSLFDQLENEMTNALNKLNSYVSNVKAL